LKVGGGRWEVEGGRWKVKGGRWEVGGGRWEVGEVERRGKRKRKKKKKKVGRVRDCMRLERSDGGEGMLGKDECVAESIPFPPSETMLCISNIQ